MVAMVVFLSVVGPRPSQPRCRSLARGAIGPQPSGPKHRGGRRQPAFLSSARNAATSRQGKKAGLAVAGRRSRRCRPSGLIRRFEVASDAPVNGLMETTITTATHRRSRTWHRRSQQDLRPAHQRTRRLDPTNDGAWLRLAALRRTGPRDPGERPRGAYGVRHDATPASINSSVKGKDAGFAVIWPALAPNDPQDQRASRSRRVCRGAGREGRLLLLPLVETFLILVERASVDNVGSCRCRARGAARPTFSMVLG